MGGSVLGGFGLKSPGLMGGKIQSVGTRSHPII